MSQNQGEESSSADHLYTELMPETLFSRLKRLKPDAAVLIVGLMVGAVWLALNFFETPVPQQNKEDATTATAAQPSNDLQQQPIESLGQLVLAAKSGKLTLTGDVPDAAAKAALLNAAQQIWGAANVIDRIKVESGASPLWWRQPQVKVFAELMRLSEFELRLQDEQVSLTGIAKNAQDSAAIQSGLAHWFVTNPQTLVQLRVTDL